MLSITDYAGWNFRCRLVKNSGTKKKQLSPRNTWTIIKKHRRRHRSLFALNVLESALKSKKILTIFNGEVFFSFYILHGRSELCSLFMESMSRNYDVIISLLDIWFVHLIQVLVLGGWAHVFISREIFQENTTQSGSFSLFYSSSLFILHLILSNKMEKKSWKNAAYRFVMSVHR